MKINKKTFKKRKVVVIMTEKKMVKRDWFNEIIALAEANGREDIIQFAEHELELLTKKNSGNRKPTESQLKNEEIKIVMLDVMNKPMTITEILKLVQPYFADLELTNQKLSALARGLVNEGKVIKSTDKRRSYFARV